MEHDTKLRKFVPLIQRALMYPVVLDARRTVLSLPPIINGAHSAVRLAAYPCMLQARWLLSGAALHASSRLYSKLCFFFRDLAVSVAYANVCAWQAAALPRQGTRHRRQISRQPTLSMCANAYLFQHEQ